MSKFDKDIVKVPFTNSLDQVLNPGDDVVVVTTGYAHRVNITSGKYLGRYKTEKGPVSCIVDRPVTKWKHIATGALDQYDDFSKRVNALNYPSYPYGIRYGAPGYDEMMQEYKEAHAKYSAARQAISDEYVTYKVPNYVRTTLQNNRVFKIDTAAWDLKI